MADDLEAFLRRAAARRAKQRKPPVTPKPPARDVPPVQTPSSVQASANSVEAIEEQFERRSLAMEQEAEKLGRNVTQEEGRLEAHLHKTFDHRIGQLDSDVGFVGASEPKPAEPSGLTAEIVSALRRPESLRAAIVLSEILTRPEHRWE